MLARYIKGHASDTETNIETIKYFFKDPSNNTRIERLKKILDIIKKCMDKPETRHLLKNYRDEFQQTHKAQTGKFFDWENRYKAEFTRLIIEDIKQGFDGILPEHINNLLY